MVWSSSHWHSSAHTPKLSVDLHMTYRSASAYTAAAAQQPSFSSRGASLLVCVGKLDCQDRSVGGFAWNLHLGLPDLCVRACVVQPTYHYTVYASSQEPVLSSSYFHKIPQWQQQVWQGWNMALGWTGPRIMEFTIVIGCGKIR